MRRSLFNDGWIFGEGSATTLSFLFNATAGAEGQAPPREVRLPHDAMIETERKDFFAGACTGFYEPKNVYYTKEFSLDPAEEGNSVWLEFEGVFQFAFVYVNEQFAGKCQNGYSNFYINITDYVVYDGVNKLKVVAKNGCESSRWYSGGGIYRDVHLLIGNPLHVVCEGARVTTEILEENHALIEILTPVEYTGCKRRTVRLAQELLDAKGKVVGVNNVPLTMQKAGRKEVRQRINVADPVPWDLEHPYLYTCRTIILEDDTVVDSSETTFGIRQFQLDAVHGLRLNGSKIKLKGGCLHHDNGVVGTATFRESEERRLLKLKAAGFNAVRTGAHPFCRAVLEICDRIGMLVYDEMYDAWTVSKVAFDPAFSFTESWEQDLENLVLRDYNHPCVVFYGIGNEVQELGTADGQDWGRKLSEKVHSIDRTRFTTLSINPLMCMLDRMEEVIADLTRWGEEAAAQADTGAESQAANQNAEAENGSGTGEINSTMNQLGSDMDFLWQHPMSSSLTEEVCAQVDIVGLNYATGLYEIDHTRYPDRVMFGSETYPKELAGNWEVIERNPYIVGEFCWTAWDYLGEAGIGEIDHKEEERPATAFYGNWPWKTAAVGVFDLIGDETPIGYWRELVWKNRRAPYIAVRPPQYYGMPTHAGNWNWISDSVGSWNWPGYEKKPVEVEVYTRAKEVELFRNGASVGRKKTGEVFPCVALFDTVYEPGEIRAVASDGEEFVLRTAQDESLLKAWVDERELADPKREITHIEISICDREGILNPASSKKVQIEIKGDGVIQGFGSADPLSTDNFFDSEIAAYHGRLLAVVRHGKEHKTVTVTLRAEGCKSVEVTL